MSTPVPLPPGSTFQDATRAAWATGGRYRSACASLVGAFHRDLLEVYAGGLAPKAIKAALDAGWPARVSDLMPDRWPHPRWITLPAWLVACHTCSRAMYADSPRLHTCLDCQRKAERNKKRAQRGTDLSDRLCAHCGTAFTPQRSTATFCSTKCRVAAHRAAKAG
jgi:hypothetical protein